MTEREWLEKSISQLLKTDKSDEEKLLLIMVMFDSYEAMKAISGKGVENE